MEQGYLERQKQHFFLFFLSFQFKEILYNDNRQEQQQKRQFNNSKIVSIDKRSEEKKEAKSMVESTERDPAWALVRWELNQGFREKGNRARNRSCVTP